MTQIHILEIESGLEAQALRAAAECWGASVSVTWVGNSQQVVDFFSSLPAYDLIFICGHGDERGVLLPLLADEVKARFPYNELISPSDFASFVRLKGGVIISSCCSTGTDALAQAFLGNGAHSFIAPVDYPDGNPALLFCLHFLYAFLNSKGDVKAAFEAANRLVEGEDEFVFFE